MKNAKIYKYLQGRPLKDWYAIRIERDEDQATVFFLSRIHVNREVRVSFSFSNDFTDVQILHDSDLVTWVINRYGADVF